MDFPSRLPASMLGTMRMSALPTTGPLRPLMAAARSEMALSSARGPSTTHPLICPRSHIRTMIAASSVHGILSVTVSTAASTATLGFSYPSLWYTPTVFLMASTFSSSVGAIRMPPSTTASNEWRTRVSSYSEHSDSTLLARMPFSLSSTACSIWAVCAPPLRMTSALSSRASATATAHASAGEPASSISNVLASAPACASSFRIFSGTPTRMGAAMPASYASRAACSETSSGNATASFFRPRFFASSSNWSNVLISMEPPLLVRLFCLKPFFEAHVCLVESLQLILPRHDLNRSDETDPCSDPSDDDTAVRKSPGQHDDVDVTFQYGGHGADFLGYLIGHPFVDRRCFLVARGNPGFHLTRIVRTKI